MNDAMNISVILPSAGQSRRFGEGSKLDAKVAGQAVMLRAVELFAGRAEVGRIVVAVEPDRVGEFKLKYGDKLGLMDVRIVAGGKAERWETVRNALAEVDEEATHIAVHDAARPVTAATTIDRVFAAAKQHAAVIPAVPISATIKRVADEALGAATTEVDPLDAILGGGAEQTEAKVYEVLETIPRDGLWAVQTPQVFEAALLRRAYAQIASGAVETAKITDDAGLIEALGERVVVVEGDALNVKITVPEDVKFAEAVAMLQSGQGGVDIGPKRKHKTWAEMDDD